VIVHREKNFRFKTIMMFSNLEFGSDVMRKYEIYLELWSFYVKPLRLRYKCEYFAVAHRCVAQYFSQFRLKQWNTTVLLL
jgi:hypothetical protein